MGEARTYVAEGTGQLRPGQIGCEFNSNMMMELSSKRRFTRYTTRPAG